MKLTPFVYNALITAVYDGDTVTAEIDLGLHAWIRGEKLRLNRINAPELRGKERESGLLSRDYLRSILLNKKVVIQTIKDKREKYGRYLAEIWLTEGSKIINVNDLLVSKGYAKYQDY